jgi:hypothetical protein
MTFASAASIAAAGALALSSGAARVTLVAAGHRPKINVDWPYSVRVTSGGKAAAAKITVQIVDPIGGVHPVQFGKTTKDVTNWPFKGTFRDFVIWPPSSAVGVQLNFRVTVKTAGKTKVISYLVSPHK